VVAKDTVKVKQMTGVYGNTDIVSQGSKLLKQGPILLWSLGYEYRILSLQGGVTHGHMEQILLQEMSLRGFC